MNLISVIVGILVAYVCYLLAGMFLPSPLPLIIGIVVFIVLVFGGDRYHFWR